MPARDRRSFCRSRWGTSGTRRLSAVATLMLAGAGMLAALLAALPASAASAAVTPGPTVNIDRDPRWGRSFEAFTEDPFLNATLGTGEINGVQGTGEMSQVKHYAVYNQETNRNTPQDDVIINERTMREI